MLSCYQVNSVLAFEVGRVSIECSKSSFLYTLDRILLCQSVFLSIVFNLWVELVEILWIVENLDSTSILVDEVTTEHLAEWKQKLEYIMDPSFINLSTNYTFVWKRFFLGKKMIFWECAVKNEGNLLGHVENNFSFLENVLLK